MVPEVPEDWVEGRNSQHGRSLKEIDPSLRNVTIIRAVEAPVNEFQTNDYVTLLKHHRFVKGHAQHIADIDGVTAHILEARVPSSKVVEAPSVNEYFYTGPRIPASRVRKVKPSY